MPWTASPYNHWIAVNRADIHLNPGLFPELEGGSHVQSEEPFSPRDVARYRAVAGKFSRAGWHHDANGRVRLQPRGRLPTRQLHSVGGALEEARGRIRPDGAGGHRQHGGRPADLHGDHHVPRQSPEPGPVQGNLEANGSCRGCFRGGGASARRGREVCRMDRRRAARYRDARCAATHGVRKRCCMDRGGDGIRPFPSGSVRRYVRTQAVRVRSLCSGLSGRPGSP